MNLKKDFTRKKYFLLLTCFIMFFAVLEETYGQESFAECVNGHVVVYMPTAPNSGSNCASFNFGSNDLRNNYYEVTYYNTWGSSGLYEVHFGELECSLDENLSFIFRPLFVQGSPETIFINGEECINCPDPSLYEDETCGFSFENCWFDLTKLISDNQDEIECSQWKTTLWGNTECNQTAPIYHLGKVGIGGASNPYGLGQLMVKDGIITDKIQLCLASSESSGWCDYVFEKDYHLLPLKEVKDHIECKGHLHNTPSAEEVEKEGGFELKSTTINQQEKIEEIFLHLIELKKEADRLVKEMDVALDENERLKLELAAQEMEKIIDINKED